MYDNRIRHLEMMHETLDKRIRGMESTGRFDDATMQTLKKQKLALKDQLADLRRRQHQQDQEIDHDE